MSAPTSLRVVHDSGETFLMDEQNPQFMVARVYPHAEANAERLARCWNAHQGLVDALNELMESQITFESSAGAYEQNPDIPKVQENYRNDLARSRRAWNAARAALAAARPDILGRIKTFIATEGAE